MSLFFNSILHFAKKVLPEIKEILSTCFMEEIVKKVIKFPQKWYKP